MTIDEFNEKYKNYLEVGHYGLAINDKEVIEFLDREFEREIKYNPYFSYSQIKLKYGMARVYLSNSNKDAEWEEQIDRIISRRTSSELD